MADAGSPSARPGFAHRGGGAQPPPKRELAVRASRTLRGRRVFEVYGGSTQQGNDTRANYLLNWEAIVACREPGFQEYDMYRIPTAGIGPRG